MKLIEEIFKNIGEKYAINVLTADEVFMIEAKKLIEKYDMEVAFNSNTHNMMITGGDESSQRKCNHALMELMEEIHSKNSYQI